MNIRRLNFIALALLFLLLARATPALAADNSVTLISSTASDDLNCIVRDPVRPKIYVSDATNNKIVVIDSSSYAVSSIALPGSPHWLALTKDSAKLGVAINSTGFVTIDLATSTVQSEVLFPKDVVTFDYDSLGNVYFSTNETFGKVWKGDPATGTASEAFDVQNGSGFFAKALIRTNATGDKVYVSDGPGRITKGEVASGVVSGLLTNSSGVGAGIKDIRISPDSSVLYTAATIPSGIVQLNGNTLAAGATIATDDTPAGLELTADGSKLFVITDPVFTEPDLFVFDTSTSARLTSYQTVRRTGIFFSGPQAAGLTTSADGANRFYLEGYDGAVDASQKGWVVGAVGQQVVPVPPAPKLKSKSLKPTKVSKSGGKVTITATIENYTALKSALVTAKFGSKLLRVTLKRKTTSGSTASYQGVLSIPRSVSGSPKTITAKLFITPITGNLIQATIGRISIK